jgi:hypothetical protein
VLVLEFFSFMNKKWSSWTKLWLFFTHKRNITNCLVVLFFCSLKSYPLWLGVSIRSFFVSCSLWSYYPWKSEGTPTNKGWP